MTDLNALAAKAWEQGCGAYEDATGDSVDLPMRDMVLAGDAAATAAIAAVIAPELERRDREKTQSRALTTLAHELRSVLQYIADVAYVDHQSGNANFEYLQGIARSGLSRGASHDADA